MCECQSIGAPFEQKLIEENPFTFNGFRGCELIQSNEWQKNIVQDPLEIAREWKKVRMCLQGRRLGVRKRVLRERKRKREWERERDGRWWTVYLEIFLFDFELHIVLGEFEATDTRVELVEQCYQLGYSKIEPMQENPATTTDLQFVIKNPSFSATELRSSPHIRQVHWDLIVILSLSAQSFFFSSF